MQYLGLNWQSIGSGKGSPVDVQSTIDLNQIIVESELEELSTPVFDQF